MMDLPEARAEAQRYLDHLAREEAKSIALQKLASDRRAGRCDDREKDRRMAEIMGHGIRVYDGAELAKAIEVLLRATAETSATRPE